MIRRWFRSFFGVIALATLGALSVRLFVIEDYRIASDSMYPGLEVGDLVFVAKSAFNLRLPFSTYELMRIRRPRPGEVVAFTLPDHGLETFVKRVVAVEGDKVAIQSGRLYVNGVPAQYLPYEPGHSHASGGDGDKGLLMEKLGGNTYPIERETNAKDYGPVDVPPGYFFALGDNRPDSIDSRAWGPVPYSCLKGRVALVWLSLDPQGGLRKNRVAVRIR